MGMKGEKMKEYNVFVNYDLMSGLVYGVEVVVYDENGEEIDRTWYDSIYGWFIRGLGITLSDNKVKEKEAKAEAMLMAGASIEDVIKNILDVVSFHA